MHCSYPTLEASSVQTLLSFHVCIRIRGQFHMDGGQFHVCICMGASSIYACVQGPVPCVNVYGGTVPCLRVYGGRLHVHVYRGPVPCVYGGPVPCVCC